MTARDISRYPPRLKVYPVETATSTGIYDLIQLLLKNQQETQANVQALQKSLAAFREQLRFQEGI